MSRAAVLRHRQRSPQDLQQLLAWYKIRDTLLGENHVEQDIRKALELASVCEHPHAVWLTKLLADVMLVLVKRGDKCFLAAKVIQELFALLAGLEGLLMVGFVRLLILAMRLRKRRWRGLFAKSVFDWRSNLRLKESATVMTASEVATSLDGDARKTWKNKRELFGCC
jgi:hypothetical protein